MKHTFLWSSVRFFHSSPARRDTSTRAISILYRVWERCLITRVLLFNELSAVIAVQHECGHGSLETSVGFLLLHCLLWGFFLFFGLRRFRCCRLGNGGKTLLGEDLILFLVLLFLFLLLVLGACLFNGSQYGWGCCGYTWIKRLIILLIG